LIIPLLTLLLKIAIKDAPKRLLEYPSTRLARER
jgi:hypothetical protein